jgi:hypothetical protein
MMMSEPQSTGGIRGSDHPSMPSWADSPASRSARLAGARARRIPDGSGRSSVRSFAIFDPDTSSWRMSEDYSRPETLSVRSFRTWPTSGTMRNGQCYPHVPWVRHIHESDCSYWPTPVASMGRRGWPIGPDDSKRRWNAETFQRVRGLIEMTGWRPPAIFVEWLMGFPIGWSLPASGQLETLSSRRSENISED